MTGLCGIIAEHRANCLRPSCDCAAVLDRVGMEFARHSPIPVNHKAYETASSIPPSLTNAWKARVFRLLISDISSHIEKSYKLQLALGEIWFYYFCNIYQALEFAEAVSLRQHSFVVSQYVYNLRGAIERGMWSESATSRTILALIEYQKKYYEFLKDMEDSCDCTIKFWSTLLEPVPDVKLLIKFGKKVYKRRYRLLKIAQEIIGICCNHMEFLIKYGLYMKFVMHDNQSASTVFKKMLWASDNASGGLFGETSSLLALSPTPALSSDHNAMMVVVSLEKETFFNIVEVNHEVSYQLGYKREELISYSANKLMPRVVAQQHRGLVQRFFQTMEPKCIGVEKTRFVLHQSGYILPCKTLKKIVPSLAGGLRGIMLFTDDSGMQEYTVNRVDRVRIGKVHSLIEMQK